MTHEPLGTTNPLLSAEDLLALERRRPLTEHEQRRLAMCLAASEPLQWLRQLGRDFDAQPTGDPKDAFITQACVEAARQRFAHPRGLLHAPLRLGLRATLVSVSTLLLSVGAAAAWFRWSAATSASSRVEIPTEGAAVSHRQRAMGTHERQAPNPIAVPLASCATSSASSPAVSPPSATAVRSVPANERPERESVGKSVEVKGPAEMFSEANLARRMGETQKAVTLYRRLQSEHARSDEALLSHVLLARLELGRGAAGKALRGFQAYLAQSPSGPLAQEALHGQAQALAQLGRKQEEVATWRQLLERYPSSVYAQSAREHLGEGSQ